MESPDSPGRFTAAPANTNRTASNRCSTTDNATSTNPDLPKCRTATGVKRQLAQNRQASPGTRQLRPAACCENFLSCYRESCSRRETIETLSDGVGVRRAAVLQGEDIVAGVIVGADELTLAVLCHAPVAQRCNCGPIDRDRLVGVLCFATFLVPRRMSV